MIYGFSTLCVTITNTTLQPTILLNMPFRIFTKVIILGYTNSNRVITNTNSNSNISNIIIIIINDGLTLIMIQFITNTMQNTNLITILT